VKLGKFFANSIFVHCKEDYENLSETYQAMLVTFKSYQHFNQLNKNNIMSTLQLTDESIMTFGAHKGKALQDVPATWLIWIYQELTHSIYNKQTLTEFNKALHAYIKDNMAVIQKELADKN
jgi:hypothetical protein